MNQAFLKLENQAHELRLYFYLPGNKYLTVSFYLFFKIYLSERENAHMHKRAEEGQRGRDSGIPADFCTE